MSPIIGALNSGYSAKRILDYIKRTDPKLALQINTALQAGHSIESVLKFLNKNGKDISSLFQSKETEKPSQNIYKHAQESVHPALKGAAQFSGAIAATGLGAYALSRALPQAAQALEGELLPALPKGPLQIGMQEEAKQLPFIEAEAQGIKPPTPPIQPQAAVQPEVPIPQAAAIKPLPEGLKKQVQKLSEIGNDSNQIEGYLQKFHPKEVKAYEKATNTPIRSAIEEFSKTLLKNEVQPEKPLQQTIQQPEINAAPSPIEEKPKGEERKKVALPNGDIGEITNIRQGIATVNANGKEYRRKLDELIESPLPEKDLAELHEDLMKGIESKTGQEISRMVNWAGYDPKTNELAYVPHTGALYIYDNISEEDAKALTSVLSRRKSTGENFMGPWIEGTQSPIGAAMSKLIRKLQDERGGKGNEYKGKYEKIYDAIEPAKIASKQKFEEKQAVKRSEKKAEKEKTKKEKENAKKRKAKKPRLD